MTTASAGQAIPATSTSITTPNDASRTQELHDLHGFEVLRDETIPELQARVRLFRHQQTGAQLLSIENDDENKVFGVAFRTPTHDSTGVAHILEHSVLGGSRKYRVKEPFMELVKGSLKTFLNAFTYPDKTIYPVASTNLQDFYNLVDVYLDAVFHPLISRDALAQEGWRYEVAEEDEEAGEGEGQAETNGAAFGGGAGAGDTKGAAGGLVYQGVVLNEMKGAYASPETVLGDAVQESLFPDTIYRHVSGGRPSDIPNLTYEGFKGFYDTYYHPANARIFFYGDDDPERRLVLLDEYLREFQARTVDSTIPLQPGFDAPRRVTVPYAVGPEAAGERADRLARATVNWVLGPAPEPEEALAIQILAHILVGTPASPLRKALIESGLGEELAGGGLDVDYRQWIFSTGLRGIANDDADAVESLVLDTLRTLANQGIDPETVEASVNTSEFHLRENNTGSFPRGLSLMLRSLVTWLYDQDPISPLTYEVPLAALKQRLAEGQPVFQELIRRLLLDNPHRTTVVLVPDQELSEREAAAERQRLQSVEAALSPEERRQIVVRARELKERMEAPDPPERLAEIPRLGLEDLERKTKLVPLATIERHDARVLYHDLFTNGVIYLDLGFDLHALPAHLLPYVPLFGRALLELGTSREDYVKLSQRIGRKTGGIWPSTITSTVRGTRDATAWLTLRGKALATQQQDLLDILHDVLLDVRLDNQERFRQMVREQKARQEAGIIPGGHGIVMSRLGARFDEAGWVSEQMGGVSNLVFTRELMERVEKDWAGVLAALEEIHRTLLNRSTMVANITVDDSTWSEFSGHLEGLLAALPAAPRQRVSWQRPAPTGQAEGMTIPAQTNFVAKGADLYRLGYAYSGADEVVSRYLGRTWLHEQIRVRGGAYGAFTPLDRRSGVFGFVSYRDPHILPTLERYDGSARFLREVDVSEDELTKAIIGTISEVDFYRLPDAKGWISLQRYLAGETDETLQIMRDQILGTSVSDFWRFAEVLDQVAAQGQVVVLGAESTVEAAAKELPGGMQVWSVGL